MQRWDVKVNCDKRTLKNHQHQKVSEFFIVGSFLILYQITKQMLETKVAVMIEHVLAWHLKDSSI